ncbi:AAA-like domain-containing protein [uncultured Nostoc sp.]|uniref:AAA-like domain-containing protein n=1 Tax=uncultured Nostoc sp. TaxID=340711 RepID=UPI0035CB405B
MQQERNSLDKEYTLQSQKVTKVRIDLVIETDASRKFQYEHQLHEAERTLKELGDKLDAIEQQLQATDNFGLERDTSTYIEPKPIGNNIVSSPPTIELEYPDGYVPLNSHFYIKQDSLESTCYETVLRTGSLIRIKAPKLMGKTSLLTRILAHGEKHDYQSVYLNLTSIDKSLLTNLDIFLRWFCGNISNELNLDNKVNESWNINILGSNDNCTAYFRKYILAKINCPLVLGLDEVDRLFTYSEVVEDFFGMLRSWHEKGKTLDIWKQLRLVLAHSTEVYIPLDVHQSPFNAGIPIELEEFNQQQTLYLAKKHGMQNADIFLENLMKMVGGHPYLLRLAMYEIAAEKVTFNKLLKEITTEAGIYNNHLRSLFINLQRVPELAQCLKRVVNSNVGIELDPMQIYKLHSLGLVQRENNHVTPRCQLYREYFRRVL